MESGKTLSFSSGIWGGTPTEIEFDALVLKYEI